MIGELRGPDWFVMSTPSQVGLDAGSSRMKLHVELCRRLRSECGACDLDASDGSNERNLTSAIVCSVGSRWHLGRILRRIVAINGVL